MKPVPDSVTREQDRDTISGQFGRRTHRRLTMPFVPFKKGAKKAAPKKGKGGIAEALDRARSNTRIKPKRVLVDDTENEATEQPGGDDESGEMPKGPRKKHGRPF